jgi:hypothetical protein
MAHSSHLHPCTQPPSSRDRVCPRRVRSIGIDGIQFTTVDQLRRDLEARGLDDKLPLPQFD